MEKQIIVDTIVKVFKIIYSFFLRINILLDSEIRTSIFIGATALMIAIVVFIADVISKKRYEVEKDLILYKTKIKRNMMFCCIIFILLFISSIVKSTINLDSDLPFYQNNYLYFFVQSILNIFVLIYIIRIFIIFKAVIDLNTNNEYFSNELDSYIYKKSKDFETKATKKSLKGLKKQQKSLKKYIEQHPRVSQFESEKNYTKEYVPIYSDKRAILKSYNYNKIDSIIKDIENVSTEDSTEYLSNNKIILVLSKKIGERIDRKDIIGYCLKDMKKYFNDFTTCINYAESSMYIDDEIKKINKFLFEKANDYKEPEDFDENNRLFNYYNYLYNNDLKGIIKISFSSLEEMARRNYKDFYRNNKYSFFLNHISSLAYSNDEYDDYIEINRLIYFLYYQQLNIKNVDIKMVAYKFANNFFKYDYYSIKNNQDNKYYDALMSNLLSFICDLLRMKKMDAIDIVFDNIYLDFNKVILEHNFEERDILDLQFATGIIQCLCMMIDNKYKFDDSELTGIERVLKWIRSYFINTYDPWDIIINFKKYYNKHSLIQKVYDRFDFEFVDHKYKSSWSGYSIDEKIVLRELLCVSEIKNAYIDSIVAEDISKDDRFYYTELEKILKESKTTFEETFSLKYRIENLAKMIDIAKKEAERKENEYHKNNKLDKTKVTEFEKIIKENINEYNDLQKYLNKLGKIKKVNKSIKKVCGLNQLIPREVFFKEYGGHENIAQQFGGVFDRAINKSFIELIDNFSIETNNSIEKELNDIPNPNNYIIVCNYLNRSKIKKYDVFKDEIIIEGQKLDSIVIPGIKEVYLLEKKNLPILNYYNFSEEYDKKYIENDLYYEFNDCSQNDSLRKEIIKNSSWLSEKGSIQEQNEYLKGQCRLRLYMTFGFSKIKKSEVKKFKIDKE